MLTHPPRSEHDVEPRTDGAQPGPRTEALPTRAWLQERIDVRIAVAVGAVWIVLSQIVAAIEPAPQESEPLIGTLLAWSMFGILLTMLGGLALRRRWGLVASLGGAVLATSAAVACPTSGHHQFGTWWYGEMLCVLALVGASVAALRMSSASRS